MCKPLSEQASLSSHREPHWRSWSPGLRNSGMMTAEAGATPPHALLGTWRSGLGISPPTPPSNDDGFSSDSSVHGPRGKPRTHMQPATKRSRSTQVSEEFVRRQAEEPPAAAPRSQSAQVSDEFARSQQARDPPPVAPCDDLCKD